MQRGQILRFEGKLRFRQVIDLLRKTGRLNQAEFLGEPAGTLILDGLEWSLPARWEMFIPKRFKHWFIGWRSVVACVHLRAAERWERDGRAREDFSFLVTDFQRVADVTPIPEPLPRRGTIKKGR